MKRLALLAVVWMGTAVCQTQQPAPLPGENAPPPNPVEPKLAPVPAVQPGTAMGLTTGDGLTPLAAAAPVGAIPDPHKHGCGKHCFADCFYKFFTYCPVLGGCCKSCSCCCPPTYTFFFCTPIPTTHINAPVYIAMWPSIQAPLPTRTPLTPDEVAQPASNASPVPH